MLRNVFDKPAEYFNLDKIRKSLGVDRRISVRELMEFMYGKIPYIKNKGELLEEEFEKFDDRYVPETDNYPKVKTFFYDYVTNSELRDIIDSRQYARLNVHPLGQSYSELPPQYKNLIPDYIKNHVPLNKFMN
jgi:type I restriction enzyme R subunit